MNQNEIHQAEWENPENWSVGIYFSKKDSRVWVPKSVPWMGWTVNIGQKSGAIWLLSFLIGLPLLVAVIAVFAE